jgi:hypothetical protein
VRVELGYKSASSIVIDVPIGSIIVARPEPTITASRPAIAKTFPLFLEIFYFPKYRVSGTTVH